MFTGDVLLHAQSPSSPSIPSEAYTWRNVVIGGGGFVTGIITHPRARNLLYARTDVGGAYCWDADSGKWIPLTDWVSPVDANLLGMESIALDPSDPQRVYLAAGTYSRGPAAILRSDDQGKTFQRTDVPWGMGGNEAGRFNGERLAVDPNDGRILFFGSRRDGLWKSTDRGETWQKVETFPYVSDDDEPPTDGPRRRFRFNQPVGIICVLFEPEKSASPTRELFAAASALGTNLFQSTDGGESWKAVAGQPVGLRPNHLVRASDGWLYLSYGKEPGPNAMTDGQVWKFNPRNGAWTDITPLRSPDGNQSFGYGAVAVDSQHPATIMVSTFARWRPQDEIFRSTNGGANWTPLFRDAHWDSSSAPYVRDHKPHWIGDIEIDPFDSNRALFTTGYGLWSCSNLTATDGGDAARWTFFNNGLEETVPLALLSPPEGAHLLSGLGDQDGFRHDDFSVSPARGTFAGPRFSNTEDMALAGNNPRVVVRCGTGNDGMVRAAISENGGETWRSLASEPPRSNGAGTIAVCADGKTIVWTPRRGSAHLTRDGGTNWIACEGLATGVNVVADPINASRFYAFDAQAGKLLVSTNGAMNFQTTAAVLPALNRFASALLAVVPGNEGQLWLCCGANGLYVSTNGGATFSRIAHVADARAAGFGKSAADGGLPAVYLAGQVGETYGYFRSDDAGQSWTRINDDTQHFGGAHRIIGDPRIYGRAYIATGGRGVLYGDKVKE